MTFVLVPFYRGAVVFAQVCSINAFNLFVLVPFYRGAVVFIFMKNGSIVNQGSRPLLSRSGCISEEVNEWLENK